MTLLKNSSDFRNALLDKINQLNYDWKEYDAYYKLTIGSYEVCFNRVRTLGRFDPERWLKSKHEDNKIHEPGLIATWIFLTEYLNQPIYFYDIGALFGYHSAIFSKLNNDCRCVLVDGNSDSLDNAKKVNDQCNNFSFVNAVVGDKVAKSYFLVDSYNFYPLFCMTALKKFLIGICKDPVKYILKSLKFREKFNFSVIGNIRSIQTTTLEDLIKLSPSGFTSLVKIDAEGHQSQFLTGRIGKFFANKVVICLELDSAKNMDKFGGSNKEIVNELLVEGYEVFWLDHRKPSDVVIVNKFENFMNRNSLIVAIPGL